MTIFNKITEKYSREVARRTSRRAFLSRLGIMMIGAETIPLLPFARLARASENGEPVKDATQDPSSCEYWRYCGLDGTLCACCGGTHNTCPPGTVPGILHWNGTCRNPADGKNYIISYVDCCGASTCTRCPCSRNEGSKPIYTNSQSNDINWCTGAPDSFVPSCATALILGVAEDMK